MECCGARVRAEESFSFRWASLVVVHKLDFVLSEVVYCGRRHFYGAFCFFIRNEARKEQSVRIATVRWTVAVLGCVPKKALAFDGRASS